MDNFVRFIRILMQLPGMTGNLMLLTDLDENVAPSTRTYEPENSESIPLSAVISNDGSAILSIAGTPIEYNLFRSRLPDLSRLILNFA